MTTQDERYLEMQAALKKDIRPMIVRANGYNPEKDQLKDWEPKPYPTWVKLANGKSVVANNKQEHDALLGVKAKPAEAVSVDVNQIAAIEQPAKRRGRPPKVRDAELPPNLD